jgi:hypothetical protein
MDEDIPDDAFSTLVQTGKSALTFTETPSSSAWAIWPRTPRMPASNPGPGPSSKSLRPSGPAWGRIRTASHLRP